jgi:hypothetical protein
MAQRGAAVPASGVSGCEKDRSEDWQTYVLVQGLRVADNEAAETSLRPCEISRALRHLQFATEGAWQVDEMMGEIRVVCLLASTLVSAFCYVATGDDKYHDRMDRSWRDIADILKKEGK